MRAATIKYIGGFIFSSIAYFIILFLYINKSVPNITNINDCKRIYRVPIYGVPIIILSPSNRPHYI